MILRLLARGRTGRRTAIPARTVETPRRSSVNLFKGHTTRSATSNRRRSSAALDVEVGRTTPTTKAGNADRAVDRGPGRGRAGEGVCAGRRMGSARCGSRLSPNSRRAYSPGAQAGSTSGSTGRPLAVASSRSSGTPNNRLPVPRELVGCRTPDVQLCVPSLLPLLQRIVTCPGQPKVVVAFVFAISRTGPLERGSFWRSSSASAAALDVLPSACCRKAGVLA